MTEQAETQDEVTTTESALATREAVDKYGYDLNHLGTALAQSGFFPDLKKVSQGIVKVLAGRELGLGPIRSVRDIHFFDGRIEPDVSVIASLMRRHPHYDYRVREISGERCTIEFFLDGESLGVSEFTQDDAKQGAVENKNTYQKWPRNMLFARAMHNGQRWFCPDVIDYFYDADVPIEIEGPAEIEQASMSQAEKGVQSILEAEQEIVEGSIRDLPEEERAEALRERAEEAKNQLFPDFPDLQEPGTDDAPPPEPGTDDAPAVRMENQWESGILDAAEDFNLVEHRAYAVNILNRSPFFDVPFGQLDKVNGLAWIIAWGKLREAMEASTEVRAKELRAQWKEWSPIAASSKESAKKLLGIGA